MSHAKNIALSCSLFAAFMLAVSQAVAAPAVAEAHPHTHTHATATTPQAAGSSKWVTPKTKLKSTKNETLIYVDEMHCGHCAKKIASKLYAVKGVVKVRTDVKAGLAIVTPQNKKKLDPLALWSAAQKSGLPAMRLVGPTGTYVHNPKTKTAERLPEKKSLTPKS